jgi:Protein of unknown function (DUF1761)
MIELNMWIIPIAALVPMILGSIWYNPKVFGKAWIDAAGLTDEKLKSINMPLVIGLSYIFAMMIASAMLPITIHQMGVQSALMGEEGFGVEGSQVYTYFHDFMANYGTNFRTFKHGALHGFMIGLFLVFPIIATKALFENKNWKYIWINAVYWMLLLLIMGGLVCQFA